jgi:hypothetical protein
MLPTRSSRVLIAVATLALGAIACGVTGPKATSASFLRSFSLFALSGAPANTNTALSFVGGSTVASSGFGFDVAVDIDPSGTTRLYPVRLLGSNLAPVALQATLKRVGLQVVPGSFDALTEAPKTGYDTLSAQVLVPGTVIAAEISEASTNACLYQLGGTNRYAKLIVDSIKTSERRIFGRTVVDPNCGFRQLVPDSIPER